MLLAGIWLPGVSHWALEFDAFCGGQWLRVQRKHGSLGTHVLSVFAWHAVRLFRLPCR
jgi:hypothetical protein